MHFIKRLTHIAIGLAALTSLSAAAQQRLPENHDSRHSDLLARQRPIATDIQLVNTANYIEELRHAEEDDVLTTDIFTEYWESQAVNPYAGIEIPQTKDLDVAGFVMPLDRYRVSSHYGYRPRFRRQHYGIDLATPTGDTVRCAFDGKVRIVRDQGRRKGYGLYVVVRHDNGLETVYGHLSKFLCEPNQRVRAGEPIALSGNTGRSTGPHLHFETRYLGIAINPTAIIDFDNKVVHKDIFAFDKTTYTKKQSYTPSKKKSTTRRTSSKKKTSTKKKSTATRTSTKKKSTARTSTKKK